MTVAGDARTVDAVSLSGSAVELMLASAVASGEAVTVGYTAPTGSAASPLKDAAGNVAASFTGEAVTNRDAGAGERCPDGVTGDCRYGEGGRGADGVGGRHRGRGRSRRRDVRLSVDCERRDGRHRDRGRDRGPRTRWRRPRSARRSRCG